MIAKKRKRYVYKAVHTNRGCFHNKKSRKVFKIFLFLMLFVGIVYGLYFGVNEFLNIAYKSNKIIIKDIDIFGAKNITKAEIRVLLPFRIGDNLLKVNLSEAELEIKKLKPELRNIIISRCWQRIKIKLYEREPEAFITQNGEIYGIDFDDKPFPLCGFMSKMNVPKIIYKNDFDRKRLLNFIKRFKPVCGSFLDNILEIKINNTDDIVLITRDNVTIIWGKETFEYLSDKFKRLQKIYNDVISKYKQIEYINMTLYYLGRVIVKPGVKILVK